MSGVLKALWGSLIGQELTFYPRRPCQSIRAQDAINEILEALTESPLGATAPTSGDPKLLLERAKDSLEEAKKQTEYQDGKAGRLLTIVAFLTAAVGTV